MTAHWNTWTHTKHTHTHIYIYERTLRKHRHTWSLSLSLTQSLTRTDSYTYSISPPTHSPFLLSCTHTHIHTHTHYYYYYTHTHTTTHTHTQPNTQTDILCTCILFEVQCRHAVITFSVTDQLVVVLSGDMVWETGADQDQLRSEPWLDKSQGTWHEKHFCCWQAPGVQSKPRWQLWWAFWNLPATVYIRFSLYICIWKKSTMHIINLHYIWHTWHVRNWESHMYVHKLTWMWFSAHIHSWCIR